MSLKLIKRHGSPNYYIRGTVRGKSVDESTGVSDKEQAEAFRAKRELEIINGEITGRRATATFLEAALRYMDDGGEQRYVHDLIDHFGTRSLAQIGQEEVERAAKLLARGCKGSTINRRIFTPVAAIVKHAASLGMCENKVFRRPEQPKARVRWLRPDEAERLIAACSPHLKPLVTFLLFTGARASEVLTLDWSNVDLEAGHVVFIDTKNGDDRGVPLHARARAALETIPHREGRVFLTDDKRPYRNNDAGGGQIKTAFHGACRRAGIKDFRVHDCRHTWATWHYKKHRDTLELMQLGGWKTISMVARYAHVNASHLNPDF